MTTDRVARVEDRGIPHLTRNKRDVGHPIFYCLARKPGMIFQLATASRLLEMRILFEDGISRLQEI